MRYEPSLAILVGILLVTGPVLAADSARQGMNQGAVSRRLPSATGRLHTEGTEIRDDHGRAVILLGVNSSGMEWGAGQRWRNGKCPDKARGCWALPPGDEYDHIASWGFNVVRLPISWSNLEPLPPTVGPAGTPIRHYNDRYLAGIDEIIRRFGERGVAVVLSMHQWGWSPAFKLPRGKDGRIVHGNGLPWWLYKEDQDVAAARRDFLSNRGNIQDGLVSVWRFVAQRYAADPTVVAADMFNEPDATDYRRGRVGETILLDNLYKKVGAAIRAVNPHVLLIFEQGRGAKVSAPPPFPNVVYSFHLYPKNWDPEGLHWTRKHVNRARSWNVPVWMGEFQRIGRADLPDDPGGFRQTERMLDFYKKNRIGWAYWAYQRAGRPLAGESGMGPPDLQLLRVLQAGF